MAEQDTTDRVTPLRSFPIPDDLYDEFKVETRRRGETMSHAVRSMIRGYLAQPALPTRSDPVVTVGPGGFA